jgi:peptide/nickel transport system permease protein
MTNAVTASPSRWARFKNSDIVYYFLRDKVAMFSFAVFVVFVLAALLAPWIAPHNVYDQTSFDLMDAELPSWLEGARPASGSGPTTRVATSGAPSSMAPASR